MLIAKAVKTPKRYCFKTRQNSTIVITHGQGAIPALICIAILEELLKFCLNIVLKVKNERQAQSKNTPIRSVKICHTPLLIFD